MEVRPRMLKECLLEDSNSCSSNGFISFPRRPPLHTFPKRKQSNALQAVIKAIKNLTSTPVKSKNKAENQANITVVRVKDIVRWTSSKDLNDTDITHFELSPTHQYKAKTTTTTIGSCTTTTSCSSWCDSDFTSEFLQSSWGSNVEECSQKGKNNLQCVSEDSCTPLTLADTTQVGPEEELECEDEQNSPVSVFEIEHEEDDEASDSSFSQCLDNVESAYWFPSLQSKASFLPITFKKSQVLKHTLCNNLAGTKQKLMKTIQRFESLANISPFNLEKWVSMEEESCIEEGQENCDMVDEEIEDEDTNEVEKKAVNLWNQVKERHAIWIHEEHLVMDYFRDELMQRTDSELEHFEDQLVVEAKGWLQGERESELESGTSEQRRQACVREIERQEWNEKRMKEEYEEVVVQIEDGLFSLLMNETLNSLYQC